MKTSLHRIALLDIPVVASSFLASCASDYQSILRNPFERGYTTYASLPSDFSGDAYYHNKRYYSGGRYEQGPFSYQGRTYDHRYIYDGNYLYGGEYRPRTSLRTDRGSGVRSSGSVSYTTYRTLPRDYTGDSYYYKNRYYAGGRYEPGKYSYKGRTYDHRYSHNGRYLYGGEYRPTASHASTKRTGRLSAPNYHSLAR